MEIKQLEKENYKIKICIWARNYWIFWFSSWWVFFLVYFYKEFKEKEKFEDKFLGGGLEYIKKQKIFIKIIGYNEQR